LWLSIFSSIAVSTAAISPPVESSGQQTGSVIGLASNALECLIADPNQGGKAAGMVQLRWQGEVEQARLILSISGAEAAHTIKVNGQPAAVAPAYPGGQPCRNGEVFYLSIPPQVLVQGDNLIEITADAPSDDSWTAARVRLEVSGRLQPPSSSAFGVAAANAITYTANFINTYDQTSQQTRVQVPSSYNSNVPTPLVIFVHGRSSDMYDGEIAFGAVAESRSWLLASPQLHGSWPGPTPPPPDPPGKYAYASLESQYDVAGTVSYMVRTYTVDLDRIYLIGYSMGGQIATVAAAKWPHVFAAVFDNKGPTDMTRWYSETIVQDTFHSDWMERECHIAGVPQTPAQNSFCYQRRSSLNFASNYLHVPISLTHSVSDTLVPIHHSWDLRDAINRFGPDRTATVYEDTVVGPTCNDNSSYHCYEPDSLAVLNFLQQFALFNHPTSVNIASDESKSYYWLNFQETGGNHWSHVKASYYPISATVTAVVSETSPLTLGVNLGSTPIMDTSGMSQPGMGLPATTYLVNGGGRYNLYNYSSGYLTTPLATTGQFNLSISAIEVNLSADPSIISGWQTATTTITATSKDRLGNSIPDGTAVHFSASTGLFPNASSTYTSSALGGQATALLTLAPRSDRAEITVSIGRVTTLTLVDVKFPIYLPILAHSGK
jgi:pimeloyl-ACP methyl ester carboxylesterase